MVTILRCFSMDCDRVCRAPAVIQDQDPTSSFAPFVRFVALSMVSKHAKLETQRAARQRRRATSSIVAKNFAGMLLVASLAGQIECRGRRALGVDFEERYE